jgi:large subunit ribosomal protein L53
MLTKYLTTLSVAFSPLSPLRAHRTPRLLLALLPASHKIKVTTTILPTNSTQPAKITVGFKERTIEFLEKKKGAPAAGAAGSEEVLDLGRLGINDIVEEVDRHSRMLGRKEELTG